MSETEFVVSIYAYNDQEEDIVGATNVIVSHPVDVIKIQDIDVKWPFSSYSFLEVHDFYHYDDLVVHVKNVSYTDSTGAEKDLEDPTPFTGYKKLTSKDYGDQIYDVT